MSLCACAVICGRDELQRNGISDADAEGVNRKRQHKHGASFLQRVAPFLLDLFLKSGVIRSLVLAVISVCVCALTLHCKMREGDRSHSFPTQKLRARCV
jgi:uncharacterized OsmC-like protein